MTKRVTRAKSAAKKAKAKPTKKKQAKAKSKTTSTRSSSSTSKKTTKKTTSKKTTAKSPAKTKAKTTTRKKKTTTKKTTAKKKVVTEPKVTAQVALPAIGLAMKQRSQSSEEDAAEAVLSEIEDVQDPSIKELLHRLVGQVTTLSKKSRHEPCGDGDFKRMVDHLKTVCPPPKGCKVTVERAPSSEMEHEHGYVCKEGRKFTIFIDKSLTYYECEDKLIHEWAHMLNWKPHHPLEGDHGPTWGVIYALVYRKNHGVE